MGGKYSKIVNSYFNDLKILEGLLINEIRNKINLLYKWNPNKFGIYFLTKNDIQSVFPSLSSIHMYQIIHSLDPNQTDSISSLDFWGALILLSNTDNDDKISNCFKLMDINEDSYLNFNDAMILLQCVTRGVAKLRGYEEIPSQIIERFTIELFKVNKDVLNDYNEVNIADFKVFVISDNLAGQYMAALGTPVAEEDAGALVMKRSSLLLDALNLQTYIEETICELDEINETIEQMNYERGGDSKYLRINHKDPILAMIDPSFKKLAVEDIVIEPSGYRHIVNPSTDIITTSNTSNHIKNTNYNSNNNNINTNNAYQTKQSDQLVINDKINTTTYNNSTIPDENHQARKYLQSVNNLFEDADMSADTKSGRNIYGEGFKQGLYEVCSKLPQCEDHLISIDLFTIIAIFENVGVILNYEQAFHCMNYIQKQTLSSINKTNCNVLLKWYQLYGSDLVEKPYLNKDIEQNLWESFNKTCSDNYQYTKNMYELIFKKLNYQYNVLDKIQQLPMKTVLKYENYMKPNVILKSNKGIESNYLSKLLEFQKLTNKKSSMIQCNYYFGYPNIKLISSDNINNEMIDSRPNTSPNKSRTETSSNSPNKSRSETSNNYMNKANEKSNRPNSSSSNLDDRKEPNISETEKKPKTKTIKLEEIKKTDYKLKFQFNITSNPLTNLSTKRPKDSSRIQYKDNKKYIEDIQNLQSQDLLDFYNLLLEKKYAENINILELEINEEKRLSLEDTESGINHEDILKNKQLSLQDIKRLKPKEYQSVIWICIGIKKDLNIDEELLFITIVKNYFSSIPYQYQSDLYKEIFVDIYRVYNPNEKKTSSMLGGKFLGMMKNKQVDEAELQYQSSDKVLLVGLYHEIDYFLLLEKKLVDTNIFISRSLTNIAFELNILQSFDEIYKHSQSFEDFSSKLFGPQADELTEEELNPIRFAKSMKLKRQEAFELASVTETMSRSDLVKHCRMFGLNDKGTGIELITRVKNAFLKKAKEVDYGELSLFGNEIVAKMFHRYKKDPIERSEEDGGLSYWEFNKLLYNCNAPTFYDIKEYQSFLLKQELLLDKKSNLRLKGLQAYYQKNGKLKEDCDVQGIGSLNEILSGHCTFYAQYESDAIASILHLLGENTVYLHEFVKYLIHISSIREIRFESELDKFSDIFTIFNTELGNKIEKDFFNNPGYLSRLIDQFISLLANGDDGIIPAMRSYVYDIYGRFHQWDDILNHDFHTKVTFELDNDVTLNQYLQLNQEQDNRIKKQQQEEEALLLAKKFEEEQNEINDKILLENTNDENISVSMQSNTNSISNTSNVIIEDQSNINKIDTEKEKDTEIPIVNYLEMIQERQESIYKRIIQEILPILPINNTNLPSLLIQLKEDLIYLNDIKTMKDVDLTVEESMDIFKRKEYLHTTIEQVHQVMQDNQQLYAAHSCTFYDCIRIYGKEITNIGMGTKDFCIRIYSKGIPCLSYLPPGLGEYSPIEQMKRNKENEAKIRKKKVLEALERERKRRNMTEEEKELLRKEQYLLQCKEWYKEENLLFIDAYSLYLESKEEKKNTIELLHMISLFEELLNKKENRYPNEIKTAVCQNNLACVLFETFGITHPRSESGEYLLEASAKIASKSIFEIEQIITNEMQNLYNGIVIDSSYLLVDEVLSELNLANIIIRKHILIITPCLLILINYIIILKETENNYKYKQIFEYKRQLYEIIELLNYKEKDKFLQGIVAEVDEMPIFSYLTVKISAMVDNVSKEVKEYFNIQETKAKEEEEKRQQILFEENSLLDGSMSLDTSISRDPRELRREKKAKYEAQRRLDAMKRLEVSKQRKILYELISTDKITAIFNARSNGNHVTNSDTTNTTTDWGKDNEGEMNELDNKIKEMANNLALTSNDITSSPEK